MTKSEYGPMNKHFGPIPTRAAESRAGPQTKYWYAGPSAYSGWAPIHNYKRKINKLPLATIIRQWRLTFDWTINSTRRDSSIPRQPADGFDPKFEAVCNSDDIPKSIPNFIHLACCVYGLSRSNAYGWIERLLVQSLIQIYDSGVKAMY
ncbi:hypothetical protein AVEN_16833-1 [Araneus ventricosus]|uniref:Uncharacterized protein n=1 Tax=Araneus ventricosus TaxID=182803 RepID=A0A4Y2BRM5_ARAVE|nr:hypothetical protein AVEN_16833-1 [Araneus ventricosus]